MTTRTATVAAVDLGASSGRVAVGRFDSDGVSLREVHRFRNEPVRVGGVLRWDVLALFRGILQGLQAASASAGPLDAVGVDGWAVDYAMLDADGQLLGNPAHYRDVRTGPATSAALEKVSAHELYEATGVQLQPFNTVFQLFSDRGSCQLGAAAHILLIPDLMAFWLSGKLGTEITNASTTGLLNARSRAWDHELADRLGIPVHLFPPVRRPGESVGRMLAEVSADAGLATAPDVMTVPSHDTAAAVAAVPATSERFAYVCTGTWALVGLELTAPVLTEDARLANFTNELGADGSIRFLRNVTGFWLLEECIRAWRAAGLAVDVAELTRAAGQVPLLSSLIDVQDPNFAVPGDMPNRIVQACRRAGETAPQTPAEITRCLIDSMTLAIRHAVREAACLSGRDVDVVHVVGGGVANTLFCQLVADACGLPVMAGPAEAASWGNALYQAQALGIVGSSAASIRALLRRAQAPVRYEPAADEPVWQAADRRLVQIRQP